MDMKQTATQVVKQLQDAGHQAVFAGGCVRDMLLGVEPSDFDVSTSATPDQVERIFSHTVAVGKSFGVIRVLMGNHEIEVATFRTDNRSSDGRHPDSVTFSTSMEEDVKRRDLTVNALLMNPVSGEIFDFVGGQEDLRIKRIRFVGVANDRIEEDALRMLRAVRFAVKFDATLTGEDSQAIVDNAFRVEVLSGERIFDEMTKILRLHKARRALNMLSDLGLLSLILPEIEALKTCEHGACTFHLEGSVWNHLMLVLEALPKDASDELLWGTLLHDVGKPATQKPSKNHPGAFAFHGHDNVGAEMAIDLLRRMKCSNDFIFTVSELVRGHMKMHLMAELKMHTARRLLAEPFIEDLMKLGVADETGCVRGSGVELTFLKWQKRVTEIRAKFVEMGTPLVPGCLVTGRDLIEAGFKPGPLFKVALNKVHDDQLSGLIETRAQAVEQAVRRLRNLVGAAS